MPDAAEKFLRKLGISSSSSSSNHPPPQPPPVPPHPPVWSPAPPAAPQAPPWAGSPSSSASPGGGASYNHSYNYNNMYNNSLIINQDERALCDVDRNNGTYIRLLRLHDGSILAGFLWREYLRQETMRVLKITKSTDNGQTFHEFGEVIRGHAEIDNIHLLEITPGRILAAFRNHEFAPGRAPHLDGIILHKLTVFESLDGGVHWRYLANGALQMTPPLGIWEPFLRSSVARPGELQMYYSQEFAHDDQRSMLVTSHDKGKTWSAPRCVEGDKDKFRDGMIGITQTMDTGTNQPALVMVFETTRYFHFSVEAVVSYDDGLTWHNRHEIYVPYRKGRNAGAPQIAAFGDGSLAVVFMTDDDAQEVKWIRNAAIKVCFGTAPHHGRISWSPPSVVAPASSFWPGIMALDHSRALVVYEHEGPRGRTIERPQPQQ